jgi:hypothetical protein
MKYRLCAQELRLALQAAQCVVAGGLDVRARAAVSAGMPFIMLSWRQRVRLPTGRGRGGPWRRSTEAGQVAAHSFPGVLARPVLMPTSGSGPLNCRPAKASLLAACGG